MRIHNLPIGSLHDKGARAVQYAGPPDIRIGKARRMFATFDAPPTCLDADEVSVMVVAEGMEQANRVAAAADTGHAYIGQASGLFDNLPACLGSDHALKIAHH